MNSLLSSHWTGVPLLSDDARIVNVDFFPSFVLQFSLSIPGYLSMFPDVVLPTSHVILVLLHFLTLHSKVARDPSSADLSCGCSKNFPANKVHVYYTPCA